MGELIELPEVVFTLKCKYCGSNEFVIFLQDRDPFTIIGYKCAGCKEEWVLEDYVEREEGEGETLKEDGHL